jgi:hypothetical protein
MNVKMGLFKPQEASKSVVAAEAATYKLKQTRKA